MNIQNTPTVNFHRLAQQQGKNNTFLCRRDRDRLSKFFQTRKYKGDPYTTNNNFPVLTASVRPNYIPPTARARHTTTVSTDGDLDYRKINFNKQHITTLRLIFISLLTATLYAKESWIIQICRKQIYFGCLLEQMKTYKR
jgi:hypothetical protein